MALKKDTGAKNEPKSIMGNLGAGLKRKYTKNEDEMITYGRKTTITSEKNYQLAKNHA
jgi:hypothetical protein